MAKTCRPISLVPGLSSCMPVIAGYAPVIPHPAAYLGAGEAVSAGIEGRAGKKKVGLKLLQCGVNRSQSFFLLFVKVVVAAGQGRVLNAVVLQCVFDDRACADGTGYEEHLLPGLLFAADLGEELIQIVENFHVGVSLTFINCPKPAVAHLAVGAEKYRGVKEEGKAWIVGRL